MLVVCSNAGATALFAITSPVLARSLGPDGRGQFAVAQTLLALSPILLARGTRDSSGWAAAQGMPSGGLNDLVVAAMRGWLATASLLLIAAGGVLGVMSSQYRPSALVMAGVGVSAAMHVRAEMTLGRWAALGKHVELAAYFLVPALIQCTLLLTLAGLQLLTPLAATASLLLSFLAGLALRVVQDRRWDRQLATRAQVPQVLRQGRKWWPGLVAGTVLSRTDILFLALTAVPSTIGIYAVASTAGLLTQPLLPAVQRRVLRSAEAGWRPYWRTHNQLLSIVTLGAIAVSVASYILLVPIFGAAYEQSRVVFAILSLSSCANLSANVTAQALGVRGLSEQATRASIIALGAAVASFVGVAAISNKSSLAAETAAVILFTHVLLATYLLVLFKRAFGVGALGGARGQSPGPAPPS